MSLSVQLSVPLDGFLILIILFWSFFWHEFGAKINDHMGLRFFLSSTCLMMPVDFFSVIFIYSDFMHAVKSNDLRSMFQKGYETKLRKNDVERIIFIFFLR